MRGRKRLEKPMSVMSIKISPDQRREMELALIQKANRSGRIWTMGEFVRYAIKEVLGRVAWGGEGRKAKSTTKNRGRGKVEVRDRNC